MTFVLRAFWRLLLAMSLVVAGAAQAGEWVQVYSERGNVPIEDTSATPEIFRYQRDRPPVPRQWEKQPPVIPHPVKGYNITRNFNHCLDCHSRSRHKETGATRIGTSHYLNREGQPTVNVSTRRYFCLQCHVPQAEAEPLVESTFKPLKMPAKQSPPGTTDQRQAAGSSAKENR